MTTTPNIEAAVAQAAGYVHVTWQKAVMEDQGIAGMIPITSNIGLRKIYADSIVTGDMISGGGSISQKIIATSKVAEQLENGCGKFDMKPALLNGPKARIGKNGRYNIIPFRHGTSKEYAPNNNFKTMPTDIYKKARQLKASIQSQGKTKWGDRLNGTESSHPSGVNPTSGYQHKNGKYEGMVRIEKTYAKAIQNKYITFRIVSDKSDQSSWIHPGYQAHNIAKAVTAFCKAGVESLVRQAAIADLASVKISMGAA